MEVFREGLLVCEFQCPDFWNLKSVMLLIERHLNLSDKIIIGLFDGPFMLNDLLLENFTLRDVKAILKEKQLPKSIP